MRWCIVASDAGVTAVAKRSSRYPRGILRMVAVGVYATEARDDVASQTGAKSYCAPAGVWVGYPHG